MVRIQDSYVWMINLQIVGSVQPLVSRLRVSRTAQLVIIQTYIERSPLCWLWNLHEFIMSQCWLKLGVSEPCQSHHQPSPRRYRSPAQNGQHNCHLYGLDQDVIHQGRYKQTVVDQANMTAKDEWRSRKANSAENWPRRHHSQDRRSV